MAKPKMTPKAVLAGLRVPEGDSQRKAIFAILDSELGEAQSDVASKCSAPDHELRGASGFLAGLLHIQDLLKHAYDEAARSTPSEA